MAREHDERSPLLQNGNGHEANDDTVRHHIVHIFANLFKVT